ncbi:MAG: hypothetical protein FWB95_02775 [Treponema sp.]|nr:hypothetical protein [Treponema sp.]
MSDNYSFEEVLKKRNDAKSRHHQFVRNDETPVGLLNAEYDWGFWDAVVTIMRNLSMNEISKKAVL